MNIRVGYEMADGALANSVTARARLTQRRDASGRDTSARDTSVRDTPARESPARDAGPGAPGGPGARRTERARGRPPRGTAREASRPRLWPPVRNGGRDL